MNSLNKYSVSTYYMIATVLQFGAAKNDKALPAEFIVCCLTNVLLTKEFFSIKITNHFGKKYYSWEC